MKKILMFGLFLVSLSTKGEVAHPHWDDRGIYFVREEGASANLFRINPDGTGLTRLTDLAGKAMFPKVSPDGKFLAFRLDRGRDDSVALLDLKTQKIISLASANVFHKPMPFWSPDGRYLAVNGRNGVSFFETNGQSFDQDIPCGTPFEGIWSNDSDSYICSSSSGEMLVFSLSQHAFQKIALPNYLREPFFDFVLDNKAAYLWSEANGAGVFGYVDIAIGKFHEVYKTDRYCYASSLSPDEEKVAFSCDGSDPRKSEWKVAKIGKTQSLQILASGEGLHPRWAPASDKIVFNQGQQVFIYDLTTAATNFLTDGNTID